MGDMWILSDYLNVMLLKHDGRIKCQPFDVRSIQSNVEKWKYNQNNYYHIVIINFACYIGGS